MVFHDYELERLTDGAGAGRGRWARPSCGGSGCTGSDETIPTLGRDPGADRRPGAAADRGEVAGPPRRRGCAARCAARSTAMTGRSAVMSFNPEVGALVRAPRAARAARAGRDRAGQGPGAGCGRAAARAVAARGRISSPTTFAICPRASPTRARRGLPVLTWTVRSAADRARAARACRPDHLRGAAGDERRAGRRAARRRRRRRSTPRIGTAAPAPDDPFLSHAFLSALEESGSATARDRLAAAADRDRRRRRAAGGGDARLCEEPQPGRICVRSWLGRRLGAGRRRLLSQAPDRGAVHAGAGPAAAGARAGARAGADRRGRAGGRPPRPVLGPRHLHRPRRRCRCSSAPAG